MAPISYQNAVQSINLDNKFLKHGGMSARTAASLLTRWTTSSHAIKAALLLLAILYRRARIATVRKAARNGANGLAVKIRGLLIAF